MSILDNVKQIIADKETQQKQQQKAKQELIKCHNNIIQRAIVAIKPILDELTEIGCIVQPWLVSVFPQKYTVSVYGKNKPQCMFTIIISTYYVDEEYNSDYGCTEGGYYTSTIKVKSEQRYIPDVYVCLTHDNVNIKAISEVKEFITKFLVEHREFWE